jgi:hypothetical protein
MDKPTFADYVHLLHTLFDEFVRQRAAHAGRGHPFTYQHKVMMVFFVIMQFKRIFQFKTQHRWLSTHPDQQTELGFKGVPHRTTLSRRYQALYSVLQDFMAFLSEYTEDLGPAFRNDHLYEDKSLFKHKVPCGISRIAKLGVSLNICATWTRRPHGPRALITVGCMGMAYT